MYPTSGRSAFLTYRGKLENLGKTKAIEEYRLTTRGCCMSMKKKNYIIGFSTSLSIKEVKRYVEFLSALFERPFHLQRIDKHLDVGSNKQLIEYLLGTIIPEYNISRRSLAIHTLVRALWTNTRFVELITKHWSGDLDQALEFIWLFGNHTYDNWRFGSPFSRYTQPITFAEFKGNFTNPTKYSVWALFAQPLSGWLSYESCKEYLGNVRVKMQPYL